MAGEDSYSQAPPYSASSSNFPASYDAQGMPNYYSAPLSAGSSTFQPSPTTPFSAFPPAASTSSSAITAAPQMKQAKPKKRKPMSPEEDNEDYGSKDKQKRVKTPRACDSCRRKKIRCDAISDANPPCCANCQQHNLTCTWVLPITETRFKRKRDQAPQPTEKFEDQYRQAAAPPLPPLSAPPTMGHTGPSQPVAESRIVGATSVSHLLHSTSTLPVEALSGYDNLYSQSFEVQQTGDGFITIQQHDGSEQAFTNHPNLQPVSSELIDKLLNSFYEHSSTFFPIISRTDVLKSAPLTPLLLYTMCAAAAADHNVPTSVYAALKHNIAILNRDEGISENSTVQTIQAFLIYGFCVDLERFRQGSKPWRLAGRAIRMAQDIGMHREAAGSHGLQTEQWRRVWAGCLVVDRWGSAVFGLPMMIDLHDCDRRFPSTSDPNSPPIDEQSADTRASSDSREREQPYLAFHSMIELSIILGDVLKLLYSPTGIMNVTDLELDKVSSALENWKKNLPSELIFKGLDSSLSAGFLHLCSVPVSFLLRRPFFTSSYLLDRRLQFKITYEQWSQLLVDSRGAITFAAQNEVILEAWFPALYSIFICALIQYHSFIRKRYPESLEALRTAAELLKKITKEDRHVRGKICEVLHLLYNTALSAEKWAPPNAPDPPHRGLNPTAGSRLRTGDPSRGSPKSQSTPSPITEAFLAVNRRHALANSNVRSTSAPTLPTAQTIPHQVSPIQQHMSLGSAGHQPDVFFGQPQLPSQASNGVFLDHNAIGLDFLGPVGGAFDGDYFPQGLLDFGAWGNFFEGNPFLDTANGGFGMPPQ